MTRLNHATRHPAEPLECEELPSLRHIVLRRHVPAGAQELASDLLEKARTRLRSQPPIAPAWLDTLPLALEASRQPTPARAGWDWHT